MDDIHFCRANTNHMKDLIERLENATGPDRELDRAINDAVGRDNRQHGDTFYTASLDAALTLVPEGFRWKLGYSRHVPCVAEVIDYRTQTVTNVGSFVAETDHSHAISLCIAALKARAALPEPPK